MAQTLYALAYQAYRGQSGAIYQADANGAIANVSDNDVQSLCNAGCGILPLSVGNIAGDPTDKSINTQAGNYTLAATDISKLIRMNSGSAQALTVPPDSTVNFPIGTEIAMVQSGAGTLTVVAGSGVTINCAATLVLNGQYATAALKKISANTWLLAGRLV